MKNHMKKMHGEGNGLPPMDMEEIPNVTEETCPQVVPIQTFPDENFQVEIQSLNPSSMPTHFTPETPAQASVGSSSPFARKSAVKVFPSSYVLTKGQFLQHKSE